MSAGLRIGLVCFTFWICLGMIAYLPHDSYRRTGVRTERVPDVMRTIDPYTGAELLCVHLETEQRVFRTFGVHDPSFESLIVVHDPIALGKVLVREQLNESCTRLYLVGVLTHCPPPDEE